MMSSNLFIPVVDLSKKQFSCVLGEEEDYLQAEFLRLMPNTSLDVLVSQVTLQSSVLRKGVFIILDYDLYKPVFGKVIDLAVIQSTVLLCVIEYYGNYFNSHFNSFEISHHGVLKAVNIETLHDHRPVYARQSFVNTDHSLYISLPYII